ncbi:MAG: hypothetical protein ACKOD2_17195 [Ilumatobacteraceae bacterium]
MTTTLDRRSLLPRWGGRLDRPDWFETSPMMRMFERDGMREWIRVEETQNKDHLEIRAELPGIDPEHDVDITIADGHHRNVQRRDSAHHRPAAEVCQD